MLRLNIRELQRDPVGMHAVLQPEDAAFAGLALRFQGPVQVDGVLQRTGDADFLWRGQLRASFSGECRRCLADVTLVLDEDVDMLFSADPELIDDPGVYPLDPLADVVDATPAIREELVLRVSTFPLCQPDCKGLCAKCGADLNAGPCSCMIAGSTN
ncbi:MAG: YceD family protein [Gemmatimonadales bacterium]